MSVRWKAADERLMAHWPAIHRNPARVDALSLDGRGDAILDVFLQIPSRRLAILGPAGAGKSVLATRFVLQMLHRRATTDGSLPVPVLLGVGSWNPRRQKLFDWAAGHLAADCPSLATRDKDARTVARILLARHKIMLVLDGFDEISVGLLKPAIISINEQLRRDDGLLLTSLPKEFAVAVGTHPLAATAVVELEGLRIGDLREYLPRTTRRDSDKWVTLLNEIDHPEASAHSQVLGDILSNPLMVMLARINYSDTDADPSELLKIGPQDGNLYRAHVENWLLSGFVPSAYRNELPDKPTWPADRAERWLRFLACHLEDRGTQDLAWWELHLAVPAVVRGLTLGVGIAAPVAILVALTEAATEWQAPGGAVWMSGGLFFATAAGLGSGIAAARERGARPVPHHIGIRPPHQIRRTLRTAFAGLRGWRAAIWLGIPTSSGLTCGAVALMANASPFTLVGGMIVGLSLGLSVWLIAESINGFNRPIDPTEQVDPVKLLRIDRNTGLLQGFISGIAVSLLFPAIMLAGFSYFDLLEDKFSFLTTAPLGVPLAMYLWVRYYTVWGQWLTARAWLALTGNAPWSLISFLQEAHRKGVLRQAGCVYQFRHKRLMEHLAEAPQVHPSY